MGVSLENCCRFMFCSQNVSGSSFPELSWNLCASYVLVKEAECEGWEGE